MNWKFRTLLGILAVVIAVIWIKMPSQATNGENAPSPNFDEIAAQTVTKVGEFSVVTPTAVGLTSSIAEMDESVVDAHLRRVFYMTKQQMREVILERDAIAKGIPLEDYIQEINTLNLRELKKVIPGAGAGESFKDPFADKSIAPDAPQVMPTPSLTFDGNAQTDNTTAGAPNVAPPDTIGDVGPNHYVQSVNLVFSVYNKTTGARIVGPLKNSALFSGLPAGSPCRRDDGDPTVAYDQLADRWVITQFGLPTGFTTPTFQCVAVSQTPDPTGAYYAYQYLYPNNVINDYPKFGVWRDAYYMTTNEFTNGGAAFAGAGMLAFDRTKMLLGDPSATVIVRRIATSGGVLPTDIEGFGGPPTDLDHIFLEFRSDEFGDPFDGLRAFRFKPDFVTPANTIFQALPDVALAAFDPRNPTGRTDIEQLGGTNLDSLSGRLMHRMSYRNLGTQAAPINAYVGSFTVNASGVAPTSAATYDAAIRWFELRRTANTTISVFDQGTQADTAGTAGTRLNNWMGSIALDNRGNIALGYSQSGTTQNADIKIAGRTNNVAASGTLNEGEALFHDAPGAQTGNVNRWGDYSAMNVDSDDDCTMWYTQEYHATTSGFGWATRIGKFKFPQCTAISKATIQGTVTACAGGAPIAGALVDSTGGFARVTGANGTYSMSVAPGTYTVTANKSGGFTSASQTVTVTGGQTATANFCLTGTAVITSAGPTITAESCGTPNNAPDPGETVTVALPLQNTGGAATTNLTATLQATGGVTNPSPAQNYGALNPGSPEVSRTFTFVVDPATTCGGSITLTFVITDGANTFPNVTRTFATGANSVSLAQNFDGVTAPALPTGWTSVQTSGTAINWVTSTITPSSAPNAAFANDPATVNAAALVSPAVAISSASAQLTFRNSYVTETNFDGMVLEYSINSGTTWTDVITGGGTFAAGGYNGTLSAAFMNPIGGRMAWTGNSNGYVTSTVNLPASLNGQMVNFRWLMGSDSSVAGTGVRVDDVQVVGGRVCQSCNPSACRIQRRGDFDGDGKTDFSVFRSPGTWFIKPNGAGSAYGVNFGISGANGDKLQPVDYDGDGKTDIGVFRQSNGTWYWIRSSDNALRSYQFGAVTDVPVAGDYTGDGKAELAVYRPSTGVWYILNKENGVMTAVQWGGDATDIPAIGDFDNDCKTDIAVRRTTNAPATGDTQFFILQSAGGA
ncbi:MAG: carboxypeptidase regulatory-like domain-containing protein, partial [Pyrinomonadaceae bacterium]|nr:carboxypeptidase regulatory-like domain-containing protein [Pyrinomonadaceae bacterium]